jgi:hypothetical protein
MSTLLNSVSVLSTLVVLEGLIYLFLNLIFGRIGALNRVVMLKTIRVKDIVFTVAALALIIQFVEFYLPW